MQNLNAPRILLLLDAGVVVPTCSALARVATSIRRGETRSCRRAAGVPGYRTALGAIAIRTLRPGAHLHIPQNGPATSRRRLRGGPRVGLRLPDDDERAAAIGRPARLPDAETLPAPVILRPCLTPPIDAVQNRLSSDAVQPKPQVSEGKRRRWRRQVLKVHEI